jgi:hypothetical protein
VFPTSQRGERNKKFRQASPIELVSKMKVNPKPTNKRTYTQQTTHLQATTFGAVA